jgi:histidine triad (HIT) family protein
VLETDRVFAILDIAPMNPGHTLVMPKQHVEMLGDLPSTDVGELFLAVQKVGAALMKGLGVAGFNVMNSNGTVAGQEVPHLHIHVIPRLPTDHFRQWPWPSKSYAEGEMEVVANKIRHSL